ncbi:DUF4249 domain-containing protein [Hymenobacter chitinivorans]|uniref:Uncharacterized protein DUF4249 n=1 Tax=Hymenobacter chitinivorans DSM 11115 TaxID=1121954 RepID=A0A2M9B4Y9_9BACT|nr:DUF4249 domain-containing protein [Hymenobacter chitinivorans]PJJ52986.1 uncharacterized protein DUF4249 [Hymenobacter chitinivorans DSM 11115]
MSLPRLYPLLLGLWLALALPGCVDPFEPEVIRSAPNYLVVSGFININGVTSIRLSRTQNVANSGAPAAEPRATVAIQDEAGTSYPLSEQVPGTYTSAALSLSPARRYQLRLRTAGGREYASALVTPKVAPPIDELPWAVEDRGVRVYVNAHDATNSTRYYRWTYTETWEFHSAYRSGLEYVNGRMQPRAEDIYQCWGTAGSTSIAINSTARLNQDVVARYPLILLPANSVKLRFKYSVQVRQYAQTAEEYAYWEQLKSNTESVGGLFDPVPSQLTGNVQSLTDATEPVVGYVGAGTVTEKRIFIASNELPLTQQYETGYNCAPPDTVPLARVPTVFSTSVVLPLYTVYAPMSNTIVGYSSASAECADCRRRGTNRRPDFWQ